MYHRDLKFTLSKKIIDLISGLSTFLIAYYLSLIISDFTGEKYWLSEIILLFICLFFYRGIYDFISFHFDDDYFKCSWSDLSRIIMKVAQNISGNK